MKKAICILLVTFLVFSFSACTEDALQNRVAVNEDFGTNENDSTTTVQTSIEKETPTTIKPSATTKKPTTKKTTTTTKTPTTIEVTTTTQVTTTTETSTTLQQTSQAQNPPPNVSEDFRPITDNGFAQGNGTQTNPYVITTSEQLVYFSQKINAGEMNSGVYFALGADIDMTGVEFSPIGNSTYSFSSYFDGKGFTVSNLTPTLIYEDFGNNANYSCGFFGMVENAEIKNLCLENVTITYTYASNYFTEIGILAACVYPTRACKITDCVVNGTIYVEADILLVGGVAGDVYVREGAKLEVKRVQSNTKIQARSASVNAGAISGNFLGKGQEIFSDICVQSEILHRSEYPSHIGAFGGVSNTTGNMQVSNCFINLNTNPKYNDNVHPLIGGIIGSHQPSGTFNFTNVYGFADACTELYEIPDQHLVKAGNCAFTNVLPPNCNFDTEIWDITDSAAPFIKFIFKNKE